MRTLTCYRGEVLLEFNEGRHVYQVSSIKPAGPIPHKKITPSATGVIGVKAKKALEQGDWACKAGVHYIKEKFLELTVDSPHWKVAETAHRIKRDRAADVGTRVHKFAQQVMENEAGALFPDEPQTRAGATAFLNWYHSNKVEPHAVERMVYSCKYDYAGTTDFVGLINGERCVLDFKTSKSFRRPYGEMRLQLKSYAMAIEEELRCAPITTGWIVRLDKDTGLPDPHRVELTEDHGKFFHLLREAYTYNKKLDQEMYDELRQQI